MVDRYAKIYEKSLNKGLGRKQKMINRGLFLFASAAVVEAGVSVAAPSIAVALKGAGFAGLQVASIVSASLASLGGGTIASATHLLSKTSPKVIISQGANLSVVMKEIILNQQ